MKILIVEDDPISLKVISQGLRKVGYETIEAEDAKAAIELLESSPAISLLITDVRMPTMDGLDLVEYVRLHDTLKRLPVLVCSSLTDRDTIQRAVQLNIVGYLVKPIDIHQMRKKVQEVLGQESGPLGNISETLDRLDLDKDAYRETLKTLLEQLESGMLNMQKFIDARDYESCNSWLKDISAAAHNLGARGICQVLRDMSSHIEEKNMQAYQFKMDKYNNEVKNLRKAMDTLSTG